MRAVTMCSDLSPHTCGSFKGVLHTVVEEQGQGCLEVNVQYLNKIICVIDHSLRNLKCNLANLNKGQIQTEIGNIIVEIGQLTEFKKNNFTEKNNFSSSEQTYEQSTLSSILPKNTFQTIIETKALNQPFLKSEKNQKIKPTNLQINTSKFQLNHYDEKINNINFLKLETLQIPILVQNMSKSVDGKIDDLQENVRDSEIEGDEGQQGEMRKEIEKQNLCKKIQNIITSFNYNEEIEQQEGLLKYNSETLEMDVLVHDPTMTDRLIEETDNIFKRITSRLQENGVDKLENISFCCGFESERGINGSRITQMEEIQIDNNNRKVDDSMARLRNLLFPSFNNQEEQKIEKISLSKKQCPSQTNNRSKQQNQAPISQLNQCLYRLQQLMKKSQEGSNLIEQLFENQKLEGMSVQQARLGQSQVKERQRQFIKAYDTIYNLNKIICQNNNKELEPKTTIPSKIFTVQYDIDISESSQSLSYDPSSKLMKIENSVYSLEIIPPHQDKQSVLKVSSTQTNQLQISQQDELFKICGLDDARECFNCEQIPEINISSPSIKIGDVEEFECSEGNQTDRSMLMKKLLSNSHVNKNNSFVQRYNIKEQTISSEQFYEIRENIKIVEEERDKLLEMLVQSDNQINKLSKQLNLYKIEKKHLCVLHKHQKDNFVNIFTTNSNKIQKLSAQIALKTNQISNLKNENENIHSDLKIIRNEYDNKVHQLNKKQFQLLQLSNYIQQQLKINERQNQEQIHFYQQKLAETNHQVQNLKQQINFTLKNNQHLEKQNNQLRKALNQKMQAIDVREKWIMEIQSEIKESGMDTQKQYLNLLENQYKKKSSVLQIQISHKKMLISHLECQNRNLEKRVSMLEGENTLKKEESSMLLPFQSKIGYKDEYYGLPSILEIQSKGQIEQMRKEITSLNSLLFEKENQIMRVKQIYEKQRNNVVVLENKNPSSLENNQSMQYIGQLEGIICNYEHIITDNQSQILQLQNHLAELMTDGLNQEKKIHEYEEIVVKYLSSSQQEEQKINILDPIQESIDPPNLEMKRKFIYPLNSTSETQLLKQ